MTRIIRLCLISFIPIASLLFCSKSDVITGVGSGVISDLDSNLTDLNGGFRQVILDSSSVEDQFSLPTTPDPKFSTQTTDYILSGLNDHEHSFGHMQFKVETFSTSNLRYTSSDTVKTATLYIKALEKITGSQIVKVFLSSELNDSLPVNAEYSDTVGSVLLTTDPKDSLALPKDSIVLSKELMDLLFRARTDSTVIERTLSFSILDSTDKMIKIAKPYIVASINKTDGKTVRDSINCTARFTVYENPLTIELLSLQPVSSNSSRRTAVFQISTSEIYAIANDPSGNIYKEVLTASVTLNAPVPFPADTSIKFKVITSDEPITDEAALRNLFAIVSEQKLKSSSFTIQVRNVLQKVLRGPQKPFYIYLRVTSSEGSNGQVTWSPPEKLQTVLTYTR